MITTVFISTTDRVVITGIYNHLLHDSFIFPLPSASDDSVPGKVIQTFILEGSMPLAGLLKLGCYSFALT